MKPSTLNVEFVVGYLTADTIICTRNPQSKVADLFKMKWCPYLLTIRPTGTGTVTVVVVGNATVVISTRN